MKKVKQYRHSMSHRLAQNKAKAVRYSFHQKREQAKVRDLEAAFMFQQG